MSPTGSRNGLGLLVKGFFAEAVNTETVVRAIPMYVRTCVTDFCFSRSNMAPPIPINAD